MPEPRYNLSKTVKISLAEYNLFNEVRKLSQKQATLLRILEAEENLRTGKVEKFSFSTFLKSL